MQFEDSQVRFGSSLVGSVRDMPPDKFFEDVNRTSDYGEHTMLDWVDEVVIAESPDSSTLPVVPLPDDKVLFPDEAFSVTVPGDDPFLQRVEQGPSVVEEAQGKSSVKLVKFRASRENQVETPDEICALGAVEKLGTDEEGNVRLRVGVLARWRMPPRADPPPFLDDAVESSLDDAVESSGYVLRRNPEHGAFGACADYLKVLENFKKLIEKSPDMDLNPFVGADLLDELHAMREIGRSADLLLHSRLGEYEEGRSEDPELPSSPGVLLDSCRGHGSDGTAGRVWLLDVTADFLASSLIRKFPSLEVPVDVQRKWLGVLDPCERLRDLDTFIVRTLLDGMERKRDRATYDADLKKNIEDCKRRIEERAGRDGERYLRKKIEDAARQLKEKDPVAGLLARLDVCGMPGEVRERLDPDVKRLKKRDLDSKAEARLELVADLPWRVYEEEQFDPYYLEEARRRFDEEHYGLEKVKESVLEYLGKRERDRRIAFARAPHAPRDGSPARILCLVGPPGVGKTSLARSIAGVLGRECAEMQCEGMEASDVCGGAKAGGIIRELRGVRSRNPVFVLDDIDKMNESAAEALLDVLGNDSFRDEYLGVPFSLSQVFFVATANENGFQNFPAPLQNRLEERLEKIECAGAGYQEEERFEIGKFLVKRFNEKSKMEGYHPVECDDERLREIVRASEEAAPEMGVHHLDRWISSILEKALQHGMGRVTAEMVTAEDMGGAVSGQAVHMFDEAGLRKMIEHGSMRGEAKNKGRRVLKELRNLSGRPYRRKFEYLKCLVDLPWDEPEEEKIDLERTRQILDGQCVGLEKAKDRILEYLKGGDTAKGKSLCFVGPPGVGKTSLAKSLAEALGRKLAEISCDGISDAAGLRGHDSGTGAEPGRIVMALREVGAKNPVLVLDEIDKVGRSTADVGDPRAAALLAILDPAQHSRFIDEYIDVPLDLSKVFFVATANERGKVPPPLQDRVAMIDLPGYSEDQKLEIARKIVEKKVKEYQLTNDRIEFEDAALRAIIRNSPEEKGVRALAREISGYCKRAAKDETEKKLKVTEEIIGETPGLDPKWLDVADLRLRIESMPEKVRSHGKRELAALQKLKDSTEYARIDAYLQKLARLPWDNPKEEKLDQERAKKALERAEKALDERYYGLEEAKDRILDYLAACFLSGTAQGRILCFVGPPGVGKTSLAQGIAESIGRKFAHVSLGGMNDESRLRGHGRTYVGAEPGQIVHELIRVGVKNPVLVLDEIDKVEKVGGASAALLEILDPEQNSRFRDSYIQVPLDLSKVLFVATANVRGMIPPPLQDRMKMIGLPGYSKEDKYEIAKKIVGGLIKDRGLRDRIEFEDEALRAIAHAHSKGVGVRDLIEGIKAICERMARRVVMDGTTAKVKVTKEMVGEVLGPGHDFDEEVEVAERMKRPGVAIGLSVGAGGGDVLFVEAQRMSGGGVLTLTGHLGDVMKESAQAALSWLRANAARYDVDPAFYDEADVHLHVPEGAMKKDGPSAGVAMATALVSELTGRLVRSDLAMTGEITLKGNVLPVGGIKEKVLAARRHGIDEVVLPKQNEKEDLGDELRRYVRYVSTIDEVLELALLPRSPTRAQ